MSTDGKRRWWRRSGAPVASVASPTAGLPPPPSDPLPPQIDTAAVLRRLHDYLYVQVRSGIYDLSALRRLSLDAASSETADPALADHLAGQVLAAEMTSWQDDAARWTARTDCDRLDAALDRLAEHGVLVLTGMEDERAATESVHIRGADRGAVVYVVADVWRAIDTATLHISVLDGDGRPAGRDDPVTGELVDALTENGLLASTPRATGGVDVAMTWRRRPTS